MVKTISLRFFWISLLALLVACGKQTVAVPIETPVPTVALPTLIPTSTLVPITITPSPMPTQPVVPLITPNPVEVARWQEYEDALAKAFFGSYFQPEEVVCEWEILGRSEQEVYVYAYCAGIYSASPSQASIPAVIHIRTDGSVINAEIPGAGSSYGPDIRRMFPPEAQERIFIQPNEYIGSDAYWRAIERSDRLRWRRGHPDDPPWIILKALPIPPTPPVIPLIVPDKDQARRWSEYESALADAFYKSYEPEKPTICEWEILGQAENQMYVWAICSKWGGGSPFEGLAIIRIEDDGARLSAETMGIGGFGFPSQIREMFPPEVQERYFGGLIHFQELVDHLRWRQSHPEASEPPLIVTWYHLGNTVQ